MTEVLASKVLSGTATQRFDPEYFQKRHIESEKLLAARTNNFCSFSDLGLTVDASAFYPSIEGYYGEGQLPFLRVADVDSFIDFEGCTRIPKTLCDLHPTLARVKPGDILFTKGGSVARIGLVTKPAAVSRDLIFLNSSKLSLDDQAFLYLYFQTDFFNRALIRSSSQTAQPHLTITLVRDLLILHASCTFKKYLLELVQTAFNARANAIKLQCEAEVTLLRALGLENWKAPEPLSYIRSSRDAFAAGRLDAEHFQPKYDEVLNMVRKSCADLIPLENIIQPVKNGFDARNFVENGTPYIRVGDVKNCRISIESAAQVDLKISEINKDISLVVGDVLFTRKGSFGNAAPVLKDQEGAIISSEIMLLRRKQEWLTRIQPEYLALFFNSLFGKLQAEKWAHGVAFYSISQDDLNRFYIPALDLEKQHEIRVLFDSSEQKRKKATQLLDTAKRAVEIAIEDSEAAALAYCIDGLKEIPPNPFA